MDVSHTRRHRNFRFYSDGGRSSTGFVWRRRLGRIHPPRQMSLDQVLEQGRLNERVLSKSPPYMDCVDNSTQCQLVNWSNRSGNPDNDSAQDLILRGQGDIITHGNSHARTLAPEAFAAIQGTSTYHTGGNSSFRIYWGTSTQLDDCRSQNLPIGCLSCEAIDYGDTIPLSEGTQRNLNNEDISGRNQCALIALEAGLAARTCGQERFRPPSRESSKSRANYAKPNGNLLKVM